ncbi:MAG: peptide deformylase [Bdellovibrionales bacterium]|nr:peptide deformylase [Bdellovibrionales bacterium]
MIQPICRMGNPILRVVASDVKVSDIKSEHFAQLIVDLQDSMKHYGGIGIAAPQIGVSLQVCVIELMGTNRYGEEINLPFTVFINPEVEVLTPEEAGYWEGCLSVPDLRGYVERPQHIQVTYLNEQGEKKVLEARGFLATVLQHELDHLQGVLYVDKIKDPRLLSYKEEFDQFIQPSASIEE